MATPIIQLDGSISGAGTPGDSRDDFVAPEVITIIDTANPAPSTFSVVLRARPAGSAAVISLGPGANEATFTLDVEGTYLVEVIADGVSSGTLAVLGGQDFFFSSQGAAGAKLPNGTLPIAPGETIQFGPDGWATRLNVLMTEHDDLVGGFASSRTIEVTPGGSISAAIAAAVALIPSLSASNPATVLVHPDAYTEPPLTVPSFLSLVAIGGPNVTVVNASTTTSPLVTLAADSLINGFSLAGASGVGGVGVQSSTGRSEAHNMLVSDCETAYFAVGASARLKMVNVQASSSSGEAMTFAFRARSGGTLLVSLLKVTGENTATIANGIFSDGSGSFIIANDVVIDYADDAISVSNGARIDAFSGDISNAINTFRIKSTSGEMHLFSLRSDGLSTWDLLIESATAQFHGIGNHIRGDKFSIIAGAEIVSSHLSLLAGDEVHSVVGGFNVGSVSIPSESSFGEGDSYISEMKVFRNTNLEAGTWSDITTQMSSSSGSTAAAFPGAGVGNAIYFGGDAKFSGLKINTTIAISFGTGAIIWEFWDGGNWIEFALMAADADAPYAQHAQTVFERVNFEQIRFGERTAWATKVLDGETKYWCRARVSSGITTSPTIEQVKLHPNRTEINADGVLEHFGTAEYVANLIWHQRLMDDLTGSLSGNNAVSVSANISIDMQNNVFANTASDGIAGILEIPDGLDTSLPLTIVWAWIPKGTGGNVEFESDFAPVSTGDALAGGLSETHQSLIIAAPATNILGNNSFEFNVEDLVPGDFLAFSLFRDATGGNPDDTLAASINLVVVAVKGTFWR